MNKNDIREEILDKITEYFQVSWPEKQFIPGQTHVPVSGRVFDAEDMQYLVDAALDFWLTTGRFAALFEKEFAHYLQVRNAILCNSGSSANLLAVSALTSPKLGDRCLKPGDEIITAAAGFPTTVNPIIQNQLTPVFVDIDIDTYNINPDLLEEAISPRTRAIILAHTLGNPFALDKVKNIVDRNGLWLVEDNCDALGSKFQGQLTGTFGDLSTCSFYPAHHITMGEGGCVVTQSPVLKTIVELFRDWGRDCWCEPGEDDTCGKRFEWQLGELPQGYDHKYVYSHIGYNLKLTDMQAAVGLSQLKKLPDFIERRRKNWQTLFEGLKPFEEFFILPSATPGSEPSWFGFLITVRESAPFSRDDLIRFLNSKKIGTRLLFGGNLTRQPAYLDKNYKVIGALNNTDIAMRQTFWIGVFPGLTRAMLEYVVASIEQFITVRRVGNDK